MDTIGIILFGTLLILMILLKITTYIKRRNIEVFNFRMNFQKVIWEFISRQHEKGFVWKYEDFAKQWSSYNKMLFSFKPLTLEAWLPKELYNRITKR